MKTRQVDKTFWFIASFFMMTCLSSCEEKSPNELDKLFRLNSKLNSFGEDILQLESSDDKISILEDSVLSINQKITEILLSSSALYSDIELKQISDSTRIHIIFSDDNKMKVFCWDVGIKSTVPFYNNIILFETMDNNKIAKFYSGIFNGRQYSENYSIDSIYSLSVRNFNLYLLNESNTYASTCISKKVEAIHLKDDSINHIDVFNNNGSCTKEIKFKYCINELQKNELNFRLDKTNFLIQIPVISDDTVTGKVDYLINECYKK